MSIPALPTPDVEYEGATGTANGLAGTFAVLAMLAAIVLVLAAVTQ